MGRKPLPQKRVPKRPAVRSGRPPRQRAGEVEARILDAARRVFLGRGLAGASIDEIAGLARAGKPTISARFASKEALFTAVVMRNMATAAARFESYVPTGATLDERLAGVGAAILRWALAGDTVGLMRIGISEAGRLSDLASNIHRTARGRGEGIVAKLLAEAAQSDALGALPAFAPGRLATTASFFMDSVVMPIIVRALFGEKLKPLRAEIEPHVAYSVAFFLAACRHGGVDLAAAGASRESP
jgi:AcrR family transcriptional regulator